MIKTWTCWNQSLEDKEEDQMERMKASREELTEMGFFS
ncbi:YALI0E23606p [Yarrowia lipolytica CLIB122]|uniref:YALI0E23606p n=1 Tax=Yarrowia lipolytica (strain CLIB 122 / E 150) TaxID=284591 RepID=Q6C4U5_YARLI|nr:YALI0E23606p [Yarrowia lipolytica CLIB122]CAG79916.2 YALI0E23606p [Yarrowia lipolytica CLIB122]|eukprot:XP_504317.2 YALI0E23606p [Yarrowia lipolytica CLIB122]